MMLNRAVPVLLAVLLILIFGYVALGAVYSDKCPWSFCKSPALEKSGAQAVAIKYFYDGSGYRVLGLLPVSSSCTAVVTDAEGGPTDPLSISLITKDAASCPLGGIAASTFYVEAPRSTDVPIQVLLNGQSIETKQQSVSSSGELAF